MEDHGARHDRAGKTTAADFVNTSHRHETVAVEAILDIPSRADFRHSHELYAPRAGYAIR